jgi:hypothetical protein
MHPGSVNPATRTLTIKFDGNNGYANPGLKVDLVGGRLSLRDQFGEPINLRLYSDRGEISGLSLGLLDRVAD